MTWSTKDYLKHSRGVTWFLVHHCCRQHLCYWNSQVHHNHYYPKVDLTLILDNNTMSLTPSYPFPHHLVSIITVAGDKSGLARRKVNHHRPHQDHHHNHCVAGDRSSFPGHVTGCFTNTVRNALQGNRKLKLRASSSSSSSSTSHLGVSKAIGQELPGAREVERWVTHLLPLGGIQMRLRK